MYDSSEGEGCSSIAPGSECTTSLSVEVDAEGDRRGIVSLGNVSRDCLLGMSRAGVTRLGEMVNALSNGSDRVHLTPMSTGEVVVAMSCGVGGRQGGVYR